MTDDDEWRRDAACNGKRTLFYSSTDEAVTEALAICRGCPVQPPCRRYALDTGEIYRGPRGWRAKHGVIAGIAPPQ